MIKYKLIYFNILGQNGKIDSMKELKKNIERLDTYNILYFIEEVKT